jgi:hypothetical protein
MTVENCKRLLKHYEEKGNVKAAEEMRAKLSIRGMLDEPAPKKGKA